MRKQKVAGRAIYLGGRGGFAHKGGQTPATYGRNKLLAQRVGGQTPFMGKAGRGSCRAATSMHVPSSRLSRSFALPAGFTLFEVLVTSLLATVILASLWSLSDIYLKLFAAGKKKIEETQIVRGLTTQLSKDLSQVIQRSEEIGLTPQQSQMPRTMTSVQTQAAPQAMIPSQPVTAQPRPNSQQGSTLRGPTPLPANLLPQSNSEQEQRPSDSIVPRFGLFGSKQALRLIVLETDPNAMCEPKDLSELIPQPGQLRNPFLPELRTIQYSFAWPHVSNANDRQHPSGLIRREWAWEKWIGVWQASHPTTRGMSPSQMVPEDHAEWTEEDTRALEEDNTVFHVPQVTGLEFRYFDGEQWESEWNSWERQRLPLLVEVLLLVRPMMDRSGAIEELAEDPDVTLSLSEMNASTSAVNSTKNGVIYRRLIHLPFAEKRPSPATPGRPNSVDGMARTNSPGRFRP